MRNYEQLAGQKLGGQGMAGQTFYGKAFSDMGSGPTSFKAPGVTQDFAKPKGRDGMKLGL